jgi:phosphoribosyl 1,2-cyclic phosphodiesterase
MADATYKLRFWGTRGTTPTPTSELLRFGGNTSCVAADLGEHGYLILDCGSGVRLLGNELIGDTGTKRFHVFFSHYHFDHIEGLPLFHPLYDKESEFTFYGLASCGMKVREILENLVRPPYFPVTFADVPSRREYIELDGTRHAVGGVTISYLPLNHPDGCLSFRLDRNGRSIVYATDHEHGDTATDDALLDFATGADYLIYDATYMPNEYEKLRRGWGHSTWFAAVQTAIKAKVKNLVLFHHHPEHTDTELQKILEVARTEFPATQIAREGLELPL